MVRSEFTGKLWVAESKLIMVYRRQKQVVMKLTESE